MARLLHRDFSRLLDAISEVHAYHDLESFGSHALSLSRRLIACDYGTYNAVNVRQKAGWFATEPAGVQIHFSPEESATMIGIHPLINHYQETGDGMARKLSDFLTRRAYHESALYRELFRRINVEHMLAFYLPDQPPNSIAIALVRDRRDFSERDRLMMNLLRPHLSRAYHNAELITQLHEQATLGRQALEATHQGVIVLDARGRMKFCSTCAHAWLAAYFAPEKGAANGKLPETIERWWRQQTPWPVHGGSIPAPPPSLCLERNGRRLLIRCAPDSNPGPQILVLEEQATVLSPEPLRKLGLTAREAEVLLWVSHGKTSPETGLILNCSPGTVNKHLEHIFSKLGVETRTAAAATAFEVLNRNGG